MILQCPDMPLLRRTTLATQKVATIKSFTSNRRLLEMLLSNLIVLWLMGAAIAEYTQSIRAQ